MPDSIDSQEGPFPPLSWVWCPLMNFSLQNVLVPSRNCCQLCTLFHSEDSIWTCSFTSQLNQDRVNNGVSSIT